MGQTTLITNLLLVAAGAATGGMARYLVVNYLPAEGSSIVGTALANVSGCLLIGLIWGLLDCLNAPKSLYLLLVTGMLGGYTTYSSYALDTVTMMSSGMYWRAFIYAVGTAVIGIAACLGGLAAVRGAFNLIERFNS